MSRTENHLNIIYYIVVVINMANGISDNLVRYLFPPAVTIGLTSFAINVAKDMSGWVAQNQGEITRHVGNLAYMAAQASPYITSGLIELGMAIPAGYYCHKHLMRK